MADANADFVKDPSAFLSKKILDCGTGLEKSILTSKLSRDEVTKTCARPVEFNLPLSGNIATLNLLGPVGSKKASAPIVGGYIPFTWEAKDASSVGHIKIGKDFEPDFVFTVGLTGCTIVATKQGNDLVVYHEPTRHEDGWSIKYPGTVLCRAAPPYDKGDYHGTAVLHRKGGKWTILIQKFKFAKDKCTQAKSPDFAKYYTIDGVQGFALV